MIVLIACLLGVFLGIWHAKRNKGDRKDMVQFAATYALIFGVIGIFITIYMVRQG